MCSNFGGSQCRRVEVSLKSQLTAIKHLRKDVENVVSEKLKMLQSSNADMNAVKDISDEILSIFEEHRLHLENKMLDDDQVDNFIIKS